MSSEPRIHGLAESREPSVPASDGVPAVRRPEVSRLGVLWRMALTAIGFARFGAGVVWLSKWTMPRLIRDGGPHGHMDALRAAHTKTVSYLALLRRLDLVAVETSGSPHATPCVVVANHPSLLDFIVMLADLPTAVCLFKRKSLDNPVLADFLRHARYVEGMDGTASANRRIVADCIERLRAGNHVVIFPEGTRSPGALTPGRFKTTAFHVAMKGDVAVQPVAIFCDPLFLGKHQGWVAFCRRRNVMHVRYLPVITAADLPADKRSASGLADAATASICAALAELAHASGDAATVTAER